MSLAHSPSAVYEWGVITPDACKDTTCPCRRAGLLPEERSLPQWTHRERAVAALGRAFALSFTPMPPALYAEWSRLCDQAAAYSDVRAERAS